MNEEIKDFREIQMYECIWCGKVFRSKRHKCMFNPKMKNCFSCEHCIGFDNFDGQRADPETGWQWELEPYRCFECELEETVDEEYSDFDVLHSRNWIGNCPYYEKKENFKGKESYAELFAINMECVD